jgi:hypothetical protein
MSILLRLVVAWLALAWSGSAAAWDSEVLLEFGEDTVLAELRLPLRELEAALGRRLDPAGHLRSDVARYLGTHIAPVSDDGRRWWVALDDVRIAQDTRAHVLVARAVLVPPRGASPRHFTLGYDAIVRELPGHAARLAVRADRPATIALLDAPGEHVTIDGPTVRPWRRWLAASALGLRRIAVAGRYLLLLLLLALPAVRARH